MNDTFTTDDLAWSAARNRLAILPQAMTRAEYEAECAAMGVNAIADADCGEYGIRYGRFVPPEYSAGHCITMALARRRLAGIEAERTAVSPWPMPKPQMVRCNCGHTVARSLVMSASRGTACPDCYDRMSE